MSTYLTKESVNGQDLIEKIMLDDFEFEESSIMDHWDQYGFVHKDVFNGELKKIKNLGHTKNGILNVECEDGSYIPCMVKKERKFFSLNGIEFKELLDLENWINSSECKEWIDNEDIYVSINVDGFNITGSLNQAYADGKCLEFLEEIKNPTKVYKAKIKERNNGGFLVDINGVDAFLPGSLAAANKIIDFNNFVGKEVPVMLEDYIKDGNTFIVSNKKYIQYIIPKLISELIIGQEYEGEITGTIRFGIFIEFNDIMTGLLHLSEMSNETLTKFKAGEFKAGEKIKFFIKEITNDKRIILTEKINIDNITIDDFAKDYEGTLYKGEVISIKPVGVFVRFEYKDNIFVGLLHKNNINNTEFNIGDESNFFISKVDCETKKIFLKLPFKNIEE